MTDIKQKTKEEIRQLAYDWASSQNPRDWAAQPGFEAGYTKAMEAYHNQFSVEGQAEAAAEEWLGKNGYKTDTNSMVRSWAKRAFIAGWKAGQTGGDDYSDKTLREWAAKAKWVEEHEELKAVEFAEWIQDNEWQRVAEGWVDKHQVENVDISDWKFITTSQLYSLFKQRDQCPEINHDPVVVNEIEAGDEKDKEIARLKGLLQKEVIQTGGTWENYSLANNI